MNRQAALPSRDQVSITTPSSSGVLQRKCGCGRRKRGAGECSGCRKKRTEALQRAAVHPRTATEVPLVVHEVLRAPGQPLDTSTRTFFESRFGQDFSRVRVHTGSRAAESARAVHALAYTVGRHLVFGTGQYQPGTHAGRRLLAHELAHVVQQGHDDSRPSALTVAPADGEAERQADRTADQVLSGDSVLVSGLRSAPAAVQRACGKAAIGSRTGCAGLSSSSLPAGDRFLFKVNCDEFLVEGGVSQEATARTFARSLTGPDDLTIHGFASSEGDKTYNEHLSCARAEMMRDLLLSEGIPITRIRGLFMHGATPGVLKEQRSVLVVKNLVPPPPPPGCTAPTNADRSGRADNPTTDGENTVIAKNPIDAFSVNGARNDAFAAAGASGLTGPHLGPQDAFRHCVWNCFMAQRIGATEAEKFATGHENSGPSGIPFDNQMDLHNNAIGRGLSGPGVDCAAACQAAVAAGELRTIRGPQTRPQAVPPITTTCIGASNQPWP